MSGDRLNPIKKTQKKTANFNLRFLFTSFLFNRNSASPHQNHHQSSPHYHSNNNHNNNNHSNQRKSNYNNGRHHQKSPSSASYFNSNLTNGSMGSLSPFKYMSKNGNGYIVGRTTPPTAIQQQQSSSIPIPNGNRTSPGGIYGRSHSPPMLNGHFAGSKYFDAPSPDSLPRPPTHWTTRSNESSMVKTTPTTTMASKVSSKRRLFDSVDGVKMAGNLLADAFQQSATVAVTSTTPSKASHKRDIIHAGGCASGSDIFSHNLRIMLNVQA